ncbi:MAG TPA: hypothetical protein VHZ73_09340 [Vicinamibacterales bacterium]|jgi:hypothetical protein|nr:hypothetical protein [Vicinamibacterales bacterium]
MQKLIVLAALTMCAVYATPASAQTCLGRAPFDDAPWQARVESGSSRDVRSFGLSAYRGASALFGGVSADLDGYSTLSETAVAVGATVGFDRPVRAISSRLHVCPIVTVQHQFGPNPVTADISANVVAYGARAGIVAFENPSLQVVPMVGMEAQWERDTVTPAGASSVSGSNTFTVTRLGIGFVINKRTSLVPEVIQLFGTAASTTFRVNAVFGFGK